ncbi:MAG: hypothetical protein EBU46_18260, partial [Nitrosomonadaceae bacterium]|nr:hypothetical protein [Nitrosomonadaceae bacterium]
EEHPVAAAVGNILSTAPTMRPNLQMLRDAGHALTTESAAGAGLLNKLATSQAAQQVALGAGLGGGMSVGEDLMAGRDVNWGKAAVNTVGQGLMSDVHGGLTRMRLRWTRPRTN